MATSGSIDFSVSRDDIIEEALMHLGVIPEGGAPTSDQLTDNSRTLNIMVKAWQARGINLWAIEKITLFLEQDKQTYTTGTDHIALTSGVTRTALASDGASGATTISVDSATGIADTYAIGVELDDGTMHWTTVSGAPSGTTITLTSGLASAASTDNVVYVYTAKISALRIKSVIEVIRRNKDLQDTPLEIVARKDYFNLGTKGSESKVNQIQFQPNLTSSVITVYPQSDNETDTLELICKRTLEDFDAASDTPDFPQEWYEALYVGLAARLARKYRLSIAERKELKEEAEKALTDAEGWDREQETSIYFQPSRTGK